jgi:hypothetical protein
MGALEASSVLLTFMQPHASARRCIHGKELTSPYSLSLTEVLGCTSWN